MTPTTQPQGWEDSIRDLVKEKRIHEVTCELNGQLEHPEICDCDAAYKIIEEIKLIVAKEREAVAKAMIVEEKTDDDVIWGCAECGCYQTGEQPDVVPLDWNKARKEQLRRAKDLGVNVE